MVPLPVREAFKFGAMVRVLVYALSPAVLLGPTVEAVADQEIVTLLRLWFSGWEVWPRR